MRLKTLLTASAALSTCLVHAPFAFAADAVMDELIITANRVELPRKAVSVSTTVISATQLEQVQAVIISDVLARTPSISVTRNGGPGGATQLRIRGAETDQTLVLIDGVPLNDPSLIGAGYNFANMTVGDISRIEVLRGPQSTLWGSQAIGGVVNMITQTPKGMASGQASIEAGSFGSAMARASGGIGGDWGGLRLAASRYVTDGYSAFDKQAGGKEKDGYRNSSASARLDLKLNDDVSLDLRSAMMQGRAGYDGYLPVTYAFGDTREYSESRDLVGYAGIRAAALDDRFVSRLGLAYTQTDRGNFNPDKALTQTFDARGVNSRVDYQGTWSFNSQWKAVFGAASNRSWFRTASPSTYDPHPDPLRHAVRQDSLYGQLQAQPLEGLTLTAGIRRDQHQAFGDNTTVQGGASYALPGQSTVLRANYGEGFKAPSLYQLYGDYGSTSLTPETAKGWDLGIEHGLLDDRITVSATYFGRKTENQIDFASCAGSQCVTRPYGLYVNTASAITKGLELTADLRLIDRLDLSANYTVMDPENRSPGANFGKTLSRRARRSGALEATYQWPVKLSTSLGVQYVGDSFDNASNSYRLKGYTLLGLRASYPVTQQTEVYGRVENLTDQHYEVIRRFGTAGRAAFLGVRTRF